MHLAQRALLGGAWLFVACLVVQFFLVGLDVFEALGESELHRDFAYTYGWMTPILVLLAGFAGAPRRVLATAVALLVLFAVLTYLPTIADVAPYIAAVHGVLALAVFWLAVRFARMAGEDPEPARTSDR